MPSIKDLVIRMLVDDDDLDKVDKSADRFKKAGGAMRGSFDGGTQSLGGLAARAGAVAGIVGGLALKGVEWMSGFTGQVVEAGDSTLKFQSTLQFAGVDSHVITDLTAATKTYADQTVYDMATIQNTTAQLAANGVPNYEKLAEAAGNLNAVAGGNADTYRSVAMVLTQTAGAGKLTTENWNQLADAIPGASGKIQDALLAAGAYTGNFRDAMAKGEITAGEFNNAIMSLGMEDVAVKAAKSTQTMEGAVGNLEATVVGGLSGILTKVQPALTGAITWVSGALGGFFTWFGGAFSGVIDLFVNGDFTSAFRQAFNIEEDSPVVDVILNIRQAVIDFATSVPGIVGGLFSWIRGNSTWLAPLAVGIGAVVGAMYLWRGAVAVWTIATNIGAAAQAAFNLVMDANPIMLVILAIVGLVAGLVWFFTQTKLGQQVWETVTGAIGAAVNWLWNSVIHPVFTAIGAIFTWLWQNILLPIYTGVVIYITIWATVFMWLWNVILGPIIKGLGLLFTWLWQSIILPFINGIVSQVKLWAAIFTWLWQNILAPTFQGIGQLFTWLWQNGVKPTFDFIGNAVHTIGSTVQSVFGGIASFIGGAFQAALGVVRGPINGIISLVNGAIDGLNSLSVTIPSWVPLVGGQTFGLHIPHIPHLALGGVSNGPALALIGDNPGGREIVQPVDDARASLERVALSAVVNATSRSGGGGLSELGDSTIERLAEALADRIVPGIMFGAQKTVRAAFGR